MQHKKYGEETWTDLSNAKIEIIPKRMVHHIAIVLRLTMLI